MEINNNSISQKVKELINDNSVSGITQLSGVAVPILDLKPYPNILKAASTTSAGPVTAYTVPSGKKLLVYGINYSYNADATSDATAMSVRLYINNAVSEIIYSRRVPLVANSKDIVIEFKTPFLLKGGDTITASSDKTAGSHNMTTIFWGYEW